MQIYVYNWKTHTWRVGGQVPVANFLYQACCLIKDPSTGHNNVLVTGGYPIQTLAHPPTWLWDPSTGVIQNTTSSSTIPSQGAKLVHYTDYEVLYLTTQGGPIYSFTIDDGWKVLTPFPSRSTQASTGLLVPKGLFKCQST